MSSLLKNDRVMSAPSIAGTMYGKSLIKHTDGHKIRSWPAMVLQLRVSAEPW